MRKSLTKLILAFAPLVILIALMGYSPQRVRILTYHCISDNVVGYAPLYVSPHEFEKQMKYLKDNGYTVIPYNMLDNPGYVKNPVVLTFDDGYEDNLTEAYPILKKYNYKASIYLVPELLDRPTFIKKLQIKDKMDIFSFQSHTMSHSKLNTLGKDKLEYELAESRKQIESFTGQKVDAIAYPYGEFNRNAEKAASKHYKYVFTEIPGVYLVGSKTSRIPRIRIDRQDDIYVFERKVKYGYLR